MKVDDGTSMDTEGEERLCPDEEWSNWDYCRSTGVRLRLLANEDSWCKTNCDEIKRSDSDHKITTVQ